jgi:hypothetical protein
MNIREVKSILTLAALSLTLMACGGGGEKAAGSEPAGEPAPAAEMKTQTPAEMTPVELGRKIGDLYVQALADVTEMLKDKPGVDAVRPQVEHLKQEYVQKLVELGRKRETLDASAKATVDSQIMMKVNASSREPWYATFNEIQQHYFQNQDFHKLVISFNIIGQYANFELLKKQEPEEAQRLGIE